MNGQIRGYTLKYRKEGVKNYEVIGLDVIETKKNYIISGLEEWMKYEVSVSLYNLQDSIQSEPLGALVKGNSMIFLLLLLII